MIILTFLIILTLLMAIMLLGVTPNKLDLTQGFQKYMICGVCDREIVRKNISYTGKMLMIILTFLMVIMILGVISLCQNFLHAI